MYNTLLLFDPEYLQKPKVWIEKSHNTSVPTILRIPINHNSKIQIAIQTNFLKVMGMGPPRSDLWSRP